MQGNLLAGIFKRYNNSYSTHTHMETEQWAGDHGAQLHQHPHKHTKNCSFARGRLWSADGFVLKSI